MAGAANLKQLLLEEILQLRQEGRDINTEEWRARTEACGGKEELMRLYGEMSALPVRKDYEYTEPTELEEIERESGMPDDAPFEPCGAEYFRGAWLGRCIGCALGQPVEGWPSPNIVKWYMDAGKYPIKYFVPTVSGGRRKEHLSTDEKIDGMPFDDDTRFTVINYLLLKEKGFDFDSWDVAQHWTYKLAFRHVFTAESQGYLNFINQDECGHWSKPENAQEVMKRNGVSTYLNPYREWIGAQIRADAFGYIAAGRPKLAARLAWRDAAFTHVKNGIYGEMFFAAFISAAFRYKDLQKCFDTALSAVPKKSRFYEEALYARELALSDIPRGELRDTLFERGKKYNWVHTLNNAAYCIAAMFRYPTDFREAVAFAVECGMDTDCNGATVGSCMGALLGESAVPADLKNALNNKFSVQVSPYDNYPIDRFAEECKALCDKLAE